MSVACVFCQIVRGAEPASVVWEDELTMAFLDRRQFHPGHTLVIPRQHLCDVRELDHKTGPRSWTRLHASRAPSPWRFRTKG